MLAAFDSAVKLKLSSNLFQLIDNQKGSFYLKGMKIILAGYNLDSEVIEELRKKFPREAGYYSRDHLRCLCPYLA